MEVYRCLDLFELVWGCFAEVPCSKARLRRLISLLPPGSTGRRGRKYQVCKLEVGNSGDPPEKTPLHKSQLGRRCRIGGQACRPGTFCPPLLDTSSLRERPTLPPKHSVRSKPHVSLTFCLILRRLWIWTLPDLDAPRQVRQFCRVELAASAL